MKALLFLIFIIIITTSCHDNKKVVDLSRTAECNINLSVINLEDSPLYPKGCCLIDSFLVLFDYKNDEGFISVYKDTLLYARYGKIGSGPNEFINPTFISNGKCLSYSDGIKIGDVKSIYNLSLDSIIKPSIKNNLHETINFFLFFSKLLFYIFIITHIFNIYILISAFFLCFQFSVNFVELVI